MKRIFIGSSGEALAHANEVASVLSSIKSVKPLPWSDAFDVGEITFLGIEKVASSVAGAVFIASPDDDTEIRGEEAALPRANVIFEFGFLASRLTRSRVALCCYDQATLPTDFQGLTYVPMGTFLEEPALAPRAKSLLSSWARNLPDLQSGTSPTVLWHGYSGVWQYERVFSRWRGIELHEPNYALARGTMMLCIPPDGRNGRGSVQGELEVRIEDCYAEFVLSKSIQSADVSLEGALRLRSQIEARQRIRLDGEPPQVDGFESTLRGSRQFDSRLSPSEDDTASVLRGTYITRRGNEVTSRAEQTLYRPEASIEF